MNEQFASEPSALRGHIALKVLLDKFGPYTGRYLAAYPSNWKALVVALNEELEPCEASKVSTLLRRAKEEMQIVGGSRLPYEASETWLDNAKRLLENRPRRQLAGAVIAPRDIPELYHDVFELGDFQPPATAEERIDASVKEFLRVSHTILITQSEIGFIDPYLNPCNPNVLNVVGAMIEMASKGCCESIRIWARSSEVLKDNSIADVRAALDSVLPNSCTNGLRLEFNFIEDKRGSDRMHARYLLSLQGGIRFDQGFQQLRGSRKVDVLPLTSKILCEEIWRTYFEGRNDFSKYCAPIEIRRPRSVQR